MRLLAVLKVDLQNLIKALLAPYLSTSGLQATPILLWYKGNL